MIIFPNPKHLMAAVTLLEKARTAISTPALQQVLRKRFPGCSGLPGPAGAVLSAPRAGQPLPSAALGCPGPPGSAAPAEGRAPPCPAPRPAAGRRLNGTRGQRPAKATAQSTQAATRPPPPPTPCLTASSRLFFFFFEVFYRTSSSTLILAETCRELTPAPALRTPALRNDRLLLLYFLSPEKRKQLREVPQPLPAFRLPAPDQPSATPRPTSARPGPALPRDPAPATAEGSIQSQAAHPPPPGRTGTPEKPFNACPNGGLRDVPPGPALPAGGGTARRVPVPPGSREVGRGRPRSAPRSPGPGPARTCRASRAADCATRASILERPEAEVAVPEAESVAGGEAGGGHSAPRRRGGPQQRPV